MRVLPVVCILLFFCSTTPASFAATDTILAGQALDINDKLVSKNGRYALGFFKGRGKSSESTTNWYLGIWFNTVRKFTSAWVANRDKPIKNTTSLEFTLSIDGNLVILNPSTKSIIWSTTAKNRRNSTIAMLSNSGNLILTDYSNSSEVLWQSFDHPTDTFFPGAKLGLDKVTGLNRRIVSWKNLVNPASGAYHFELDPSGINQLLLLSLNLSVPYWSSGVWNGKYFASIPEMTSDHPIFSSTFVDNDQEKYFTYNLVHENMVTRHVIDVSGQTKTFIWLEDSQDWTMIYAQPKAQCDVYAICGAFTTCTDNVVPHCNCMEGFTITSPEDWELEDRSGGCSRITQLDCTSNKSTTHTTDKFYSVPCVRSPQDNPKVEAARSAGECAQVCLNNCSCTAYSFGYSGCSIWYNELLNVRQLQCSDTANSSEETIFLRLSAKDVQSLKNNRRGTVVGAVTGAGIFVLCLLALILSLMIWRNKRKSSGHISNVFQGCSGIIAFRYNDLQGATKKFTDKLGEGSFGSVFKGFINDSIAIAVKRLDGAYQDFGMAKLLGRDFSRVLTTMRGTAGYLAPEWISGVAITPKVDVYSYGMVLLEIISGRRNTCTTCSSNDNLDVYFPVHAAHKLLEGDMESLLDHMLHGDVNLDEAELVCKVACWCIQDDEFDRPTMGEVVQILEKLVEIRMPPIPRLLQAMAGSSSSICS
ncbi:hypothetical protein BRADI_1g06280v3 [Brachypodium distachyon]|nr:hypothetical protein BRADI_1g06280v3 [Brachypodium distachyon]